MFIVKINSINFILQPLANNSSWLLPADHCYNSNCVAIMLSSEMKTYCNLNIGHTDPQIALELCHNDDVSTCQ